MKTLNQFVSEARKSYLKVRSPDEQRFVDKHIVAKHQDNNGNGDDVFNASNVKTINRKSERHGYDVDDDEKVYEEVEQIDEVLKPSMGVKAYINDFIKSENPRFSGDSKEQRRKRAIAAYYSDLRGEGLEINDSIIESLSDTFAQLSETNQDSFIEMSESEDGINQLIDFIISNRGNE